MNELRLRIGSLIWQGVLVMGAESLWNEIIQSPADLIEKEHLGNLSLFLMRPAILKRGRTKQFYACW